MSVDGLEFYFDSDRPGGQGWDIWVVKRASKDDEWGEPENLGSMVNSSGEDGFASISANGLSLYFYSNRPGGNGSYDLYMTTRETKTDPWGMAVNMGSIINSGNVDTSPWISMDGLELYFDSMRGGGYGGYDIWVVTRPTENDPWGEPFNLGSVVNSGYHDSGPCLSPDGLILFFDDYRAGRARPGGFGTTDIWMSRRTTISDSWSEPVNLGPKINGAYGETQLRISPDGETVYFASDRPGGYGGTWGDIYQAAIIPICDFNGDGIVDIDDLVIMIENWGTSESLCDIGPMAWGDGIVDREDLKVLMEYYNQVIGALAYYKLDEAVGDIAFDSSGNYYDANVIGDANWQPECGMIDGAIELDGIDDYISTPFILNPRETSEFSVFAWIKGGAAGEVILSQAGGVNWLLADSLDGCLMTELRYIGGREEQPSLISSALITDGGWHRVGFVWDGTNRILYVDDFEVASDTQSHLTGSEGGLYIGAGKDLDEGTFFSGLIDDVRIYNRVIVP